MNLNDAKKMLAPHMNRPIRAFLSDKRVAGTETENAFWLCVYANTNRVCHGDVTRIEATLEGSAKNVSTVLDGVKFEREPSTPSMREQLTAAGERLSKALAAVREPTSYEDDCAAQDLLERAQEARTAGHPAYRAMSSAETFALSETYAR